MPAFIEPRRIADAAQKLVGSVNPLFVDFLILKFHGLSHDKPIAMTTDATKDGCNLVMGVHRANGGPAVPGRPFFNPFKRRDHWLREGYPRFGTYSNLDGQTLARFVDFPSSSPPRSLRLQADYVALMSQHLRIKARTPIGIPLGELSVWCARAQSLPDDASLQSVIDWFLKTFRITQEERQAFFPAALEGSDPIVLISALDADALADQLVERFPSGEVQPPEGSTEQATADPDVSTSLFERIAEGMVISELTIKQLVTLVRLGRNVILTGAPGTGKSSLALNLAAVATTEANLHSLPACDGWLPTTATADWTTFDTIGGYVPNVGGALEFREGLFLRAIRENKWLIIDELNRCDADKAFGQLFTVLSGQAVELPFRDANGNNIRIAKDKTGAKSRFDEPSATYLMGSDWRVIATMNTFDRNHLFLLSAAFVRRFATLNVPVPTSTQLGDWFETKGLQSWALSRVRRLVEFLERERSLGPAIWGDIAEYLAYRLDAQPNLELEIGSRNGMPVDPNGDSTNSEAARSEASEKEELLEDPFLEVVIAYVLPQLDGMDVAAYHRIRRGLEEFVRPSSFPVLRSQFSELFRA